MRIGDLAEQHIPEILEIEKASNGSPWTERAFRNELGHQHGIFLVAHIEGKVAGYACAWILADEAHVTNIAVHPEHRRQGLGRKLILELLLRAQERGAICATLEVRAGNEAAIAMYEGLGFESCGRRKGYYPDNREDAIVMWLFNLDSWRAA